MTDSTFVRAEIDFASGDDKVAEGADDFMGQQLEFRWRYQALPDLRLEFGGAYLHKGGGLETGDYSDDTQFAYTAFLYSF